MSLKLLLAGIVGIGVSLTVITTYMLVMTVIIDWSYVAAQLKEFGWLIVAFAPGLGLQWGLPVYLWRDLKEKEKILEGGVL